MCFSFTLKTDLIKEENSQTLTQMLETSYVLHDFTLLDSLPFSRSSLSVSQQRSGSCYSHGKLPVTTTVRHVSILHWRRTRQRVNTTVLRERYRRRGGTRKRKIQTDKKETGRGAEERALQSVRGGRQKERPEEGEEGWMWPEFEPEWKPVDKSKREKEVMESVLTQNYPVGWGGRRGVTCCSNRLLSWVQMFASTHKLILTLLSRLIGSALTTNNFLLVFTKPNVVLHTVKGGTPQDLFESSAHMK